MMVTTEAISRAKLQSNHHQSSPSTNLHPVFYRPDALPVAQPTVSKHRREIQLYVHISENNMLHVRRHLVDLDMDFDSSRI